MFNIFLLIILLITVYNDWNYYTYIIVGLLIALAIIDIIGSYTYNRLSNAQKELINSHERLAKVLLELLRKDK